MRAWAAVTCALGALAGCVDTSPGPAVLAPVAGITLVGAADGLDVAGSGGRQIGFGRARIGALETITRIEGRAPVPAPCAAPTLDAFEARGGLILVFTSDRFVGWSTGAAAAGRTCT